MRCAQKDSDSLFQTIATHNIYFANVVFDELLARKWTVNEIGAHAAKVSGLLYEAIDKSGGKLVCSLPKRARSATVVVFRISDPTLGHLLNKKLAANGFTQEADARGAVHCYTGFQTTEAQVREFLSLLRTILARPSL